MGLKLGRPRRDVPTWPARLCEAKAKKLRRGERPQRGVLLSSSSGLVAMSLKSRNPKPHPGFGGHESHPKFVVHRNVSGSSESGPMAPKLFAPGTAISPMFSNPTRGEALPQACKELPSRQTWKCTDPCRKATFLLERSFVHFHLSGSVKKNP